MNANAIHRSFEILWMFFLPMLAAEASGGATTVYEVVAPPGGAGLTVNASGSLQVGNTVRLDGEKRIVDSVSYHVKVFDIGVSNIKADFQGRFFLNDGPGDSPGTLLWESSVMDDVLVTAENMGSVITFDAPLITVPDEFVITLEITDPSITGSGPARVGILSNDSATLIGSSVESWGGSLGTNGPWSKFIVGAGAGPPNFLIKVTAVPEPTTSVLLLAALSLAMCKRRH